MFLYGERAWVQFCTKDWPVWQKCCCSSTNRKRQQLRDDTSDSDRGIPEEEKLVQTRDENGPDYTNHPGSQSRNGNGWIIRISYSRTNLWVWTLIFESHMFLVQVGIVESCPSWVLAGKIWTSEENVGNNILLTFIGLAIQSSLLNSLMNRSKSSLPSIASSMPPSNFISSFLP